MSKIKLLSSKTINQIAAGEVIDRPTSVIKELVENAIDAGADEIIVELERGGRNLIAVHDNGCGMGANDLLMAIERHATSKLDEDDISHIINFGFRGEALPSIGSIAKLTITSKTEDAETACMLTIEADNKPFIHPATRKTGTTVEVRDIFALLQLG